MFLSRVELGPLAAEREAFWREISQPYGAHQALWGLLSRGAEQRRDFLYRPEERAGRLSFLVLSADVPRAPADGMWLVEAKPFAPEFRRGQRLGFRLRASPVVRKGEKIEGRHHGKVRRHDVVMDQARTLEAAGHPLPEPSVLARDAGLAWLSRQGERCGFSLPDVPVERIGSDGLLEEAREAAVRVDGYRQHRIARRGTSPIRFSTLDFEGVLAVVEPEVFMRQVCAGFGPQKAFGCGLMLLRRA
jgi:CRISPR system Cascade subunit CasE